MSNPLPLRVEPLTPNDFAPFGDVFWNDGSVRRRFYPDAVAPGVGPGELRFWISRVEPHQLAGSVLIERLERHPFAPQTFVPIEVSRWLVVVAPRAADGSPDVARIRAFSAGPGVGICYKRGTWHHGMIVLDRAAQFGVVMWRRHAADDDEHFELQRSLAIRAAT